MNNIMILKYDFVDWYDVTAKSMCYLRNLTKE